MKNITSNIVYHQPGGDIPENLIIWQDENHGIGAIISAAHDIVNGKTVKFAICDREGTMTPTIREVVTLAMGKDGPRYCSGNKPDGPGSYALIASWYGYCKKPEAISAALIAALGPLFFRLKI